MQFGEPSMTMRKRSVDFSDMSSSQAQARPSVMKKSTAINMSMGSRPRSNNNVVPSSRIQKPINMTKVNSNIAVDAKRKS